MILDRLGQGLAMAGQKVTSALGLGQQSSGASGKQEAWESEGSFGLELNSEVRLDRHLTGA